MSELQHPEQHSQLQPTSTPQFSASKITITLSYALSVVGVSMFMFTHSGKHYQTPFTGILPITFLYWFVTLLSQFVFLFKLFFNSTVSSTNQANVLAIVGPHFTISNIFNFFWCWFFMKEKFIISEIILILNFLNLLMLYFTHKTISIKNVVDWLTIHLPVTGLPLAWNLYAIFWNGACVFHSHNNHLLPRLLANIFIWEFLVVPGSLLILYGDWSVGFATSVLLFSVGLCQFFIKIVALQWIFAMVIAGIDFLLSIIVLFSGAIKQVDGAEPAATQNEQAPLLT